MASQEGDPQSAMETENVPATGQEDQQAGEAGEGTAKPLVEGEEPSRPGKVSNACCQHPTKKKKKNPYAEGFADAIADESAKPELTEEQKEQKELEEDEEAGQLITEEQLIDELGIDKGAEHINMVQFRIFDMDKVAFHTLTNCKELILRQNLIHDLKPLPPNLSGLVELDLYDNKIRRIQHLTGLPNLRVLDLSYNNIRIIEGLTELPSLEVLFLTENKISKIEGLDALPNLRQLELGSNRIRKIEGLDHLAKLEQLWLGKNKITSLEGLGGLPSLKKLSFQANRITQIPPGTFDSNLALEDLHLSENGIKVIENISHMKRLRLVDFCFNPITAISEVDTLPALEEFWITDAKISSWKEVEKLTAVKTLRTVYLERNPVEDARYRHKLASLLPWLKEIDSWPIVRRDLTGKVEDGVDPRGHWVDTPVAEETFKTSRGELPMIRPIQDDGKGEKKDDGKGEKKEGACCAHETKEPEEPRGEVE